VPSPAPPTPDPATGYAPAAATDTTLWLPLHRAIGTIALERVGVRYRNSDLFVVVDASIGAGPLQLGLAGLGVGSSLSGFDPKFTIDGIDVAYSAGTVDISGGLVRQQRSDAGKTVDLYAGELTVQVADVSLSAVGAYTTVGGTPSFFAFALLRDPPLGGPPFFFVTGLAAGVGYNSRLPLPTVDQVPDFPLIQAAMPGGGGPLAQAPDDPVATLQSFAAVTPAVGEYWLTAGVRFTSFEMVESVALLDVTAGARVLVSVLGLSRMSVPTGAPDPIAYAEVALVAIFDPVEAVLRVDAKLTPSSYIFSPDARLTGGFAFYSWFDEGDFVLSFGGYHPHFDAPAKYPSVDRLALDWHVSDHLQVTASGYFALTPSAVMAGGHLSAVWQSGDVTAWFTVDANFLLSWKPFEYAIDVSVQIGASFEVDLLFVSFTMTIHVGVDLSLWGPPFGGTATVDLDVISFTVGFGGDRPDAPRLTWDEFQGSFLPHPPAGGDPVLCDTRLAAGLVKDATRTSGRLLVNPAELDLAVVAPVPVQTLTVGAAPSVESESDPTATLGIAPMGCGPDGWTSSLTIILTRAGAASETPLDHFDSFTVTSAAPLALWGTRDPADPAGAAAALGPDQVVDGSRFGVRLVAKPPVPGVTRPVAVADLLYSDAPPVTLAMRAAPPAAPAPPSAPGPVASTIAGRGPVRDAITRALVRRGHLAGFDTRTIDVAGLAKDADALLEQPVVAALA